MPPHHRCFVSPDASGNALASPLRPLEAPIPSAQGDEVVGTSGQENKGSGMVDHRQDGVDRALGATAMTRERRRGSDYTADDEGGDALPSSPLPEERTPSPSFLRPQPPNTLPSSPNSTLTTSRPSSSPSGVPSDSSAPLAIRGGEAGSCQRVVSGDVQSTEGIPSPMPPNHSPENPSSIDPCPPPPSVPLHAPDPPPSSLIPSLVTELTCPACHQLFHDPTTLACGHTTCMSCSQLRHLALRRDSSDLLLSSDLLSVGDGVPISESQFARNPSTPMVRTSSGSLFSTLLHIGSPTDSTPSPIASPPSATSPLRAPRPSPSRPIIARGKLTCPHAACKLKDRAATLSEPKVDYVLQKVVGLLRREVEDVDLLAGVEEAGEGVKRRGRTGGESFTSQSSRESGGGEDPIPDADSKRVRKTRGMWESSKRSRRDTAGASEDAETMGTEAEEEREAFLAELQSELECQICVQLLYHPVTSPCGHTFCRRCLHRSLDHSPTCPLCRNDFPSFAYFQSQPVNVTTSRVILTAWPTFASDRKAALEAEETSSNLDTPIFFSHLAWPNLPIYIHVFEPRYRLMMRRCLAGDRMFGMVLPSRDGTQVNSFGTMLYIKSFTMISEDGRSMVETVGMYRFRLVETDTLDGYTIGRIERVEDVSPEQEAELEREALARNDEIPPSSALSSDPPHVELSTTDLMEGLLEFVENLRSGSVPWVIQRLNNTIGPMPTDPSDFSFWMAEVMPVDDHLKATLLPITSPRERLRVLAFWAQQLSSSWWFARGCSLM